MDTLTLALTHEALSLRSIRQASRKMHRAPSTVSTALSRLEAAIALPLMNRENGNLVLTVEAERRLPAITATVRHIDELLAVSGQTDADKAPSFSIECLARFSAVAHTGSIRSAARSLGVGQPQLARQMAGMERHLNCKLLARSANGVELTEQGHRVLASAQAIVEGWREISRAADNRFRRDIRTWHIGTIMPLGHESSISAMLADLVVEWAPQQARHPLRITSGTADTLLAGLKSREYDVVVLDHGHIPADLDSAVISSTPFAIVGHADTIAGISDIPTLLHRHPIALPSRKSGVRQEAARFIEAALGEDAANRIDILEIDSIPVITNLVVRHGYLSVLPLASIMRLPFSLARISLEPDHIQRLVVVWRRNSMPKPLVDAIKRNCVADTLTDIA